MAWLQFQTRSTYLCMNNRPLVSGLVSIAIWHAAVNTRFIFCRCPLPCMTKAPGIVTFSWFSRLSIQIWRQTYNRPYFIFYLLYLIWRCIAQRDGQNRYFSGLKVIVAVANGSSLFRDRTLLVRREIFLCTLPSQGRSVSQPEIPAHVAFLPRFS